MAYATVADVDVRWDEPSFLEDPEMVAYVNTLLDEAHLILAGKIPGLPARIASGRPSSDLVKMVVVRVVIRVLNNPKGFQGEHAADTGWYLPQAAAGVSNEVSFTDRDLAQLGGRRSRLGSIPIAIPEYRQIHSSWRWR